MNFGTPVPLLIGIVLIVGAMSLFFLDKLKPGYGRDADKVYSILLLISGLFLLAHLTMELLASFQQVIMVGVIVALFIENIQNRPPRDDRGGDRDPYPGGYGDSDYRDPAPPAPYRPSRALESRRTPRTNVRARLDDEPYPMYGDRRPALRGWDEGDRPSPRRRPTSASRPTPRLDASRVRPDWDAEPVEPRPTRSSDRPPSRPPLPPDDEPPVASSGTSYRMRPPSRNDEGSRRRPPSNSPSSDYVDYRPIDYPSESS
ncbi:MAG TPA: Ycf66 family protein [Candidatus Obscuribacterales bacterium]